MKAFLEPLKKLSAYEEIHDKLGKNQGVLQLSGCMDSQKVHIACGLGEEFPLSLIHI